MRMRAERCGPESGPVKTGPTGPVATALDSAWNIGLAHSNRAQCQTNPQGHLLMDMIDRTGHYAVSLSDLAEGSLHTFCSGGRNTTVDYCFIDCWAAHLVLDCEVKQHHPLNLSDHLALNVKLNCKPQQMTPHENTNHKLNWRKLPQMEALKTSRIWYPLTYLHFLSILC